MYICGFQSPYKDIYYTALGDETVLRYFGVNDEGGLICLRSQWQYPDRNVNTFEVSFFGRVFCHVL